MSQAPPPISEDIWNDIITMNYFQRGTITIFGIMVLIACFISGIQLCRGHLDRNLLQDDDIKRYKNKLKKEGQESSSSQSNKKETGQQNKKQNINKIQSAINLNRNGQLQLNQNQNINQKHPYKLNMFFEKSKNYQLKKEIQQNKQNDQKSSNEKHQSQHIIINSIGMITVSYSKLKQKQNNTQQQQKQQEQQSKKKKKNKNTLSILQSIIKSLFQSNYFFAIKIFWLMNFICGTNYGFSFALFFILMGLKLFFILISFCDKCENSIIPKILDEAVWVIGAFLWALNLWTINNPLFQFSITEQNSTRTNITQIYNS